MKLSVIIIISMLLFSIPTFCQESFSQNILNDFSIKIEWVNNLGGDFSFSEEWSYPDGVYKNDFGQLSCDGFCPERTYSMKDQNGKIFQDSLDIFYTLVDTSHLYHTIDCNAKCYEWAGADYISYSKNSDTLLFYTMMNVATHSSLDFTIINDYCFPKIVLISITSYEPSNLIFNCTGGYIKIDSIQWQQNILKAEFHFDFFDDKRPQNKMFWEGKIFKPLTD